MVVQKKLISGKYVPDLPNGVIYETATLSPDNETYTITGAVMQNGTPFSVNQMQGKLLLNKMGLFEATENLIAQSDSETKIYWQTASVWERTSPIIKRFADQLGMSEQELDEFFTQAAKIN